MCMFRTNMVIPDTKLNLKCPYGDQVDLSLNKTKQKKKFFLQTKNLKCTVNPYSAEFLKIYQLL